MLTRLALKGRVITLVIMVAVMAAGAYSLGKLPLELLPDLDFPVVTVSAFYADAEPGEVLQDVTRPIEDALKGTPDVVSVRSVSAPSLSQIIVQAEFGDDMKAMEAEIVRRTGSLALPPGVAARVARINPDEFPVLEISVLGGDATELAVLVNSTIVPAIEAVPGVLNADVPPGIEDGISISRTNGEPSIPINILKQPDANTVTVSKAVVARLSELRASLPGEVRFIEISNQAPSIEGSINELRQEVALGAVLAVTVIFAFLLSVRPTIVTAVSIPVSVLAAFIFMAWQGMSLNILTLGGLAIAVGRVVDDSIVVMENVYRHIQMDETPRQAALNATREVALPITASTLTTIAVFIPLVFIGGFIGVVFVPFALTITYALLASLVAALTVVPVLGSIFIKKGKPRTENALERVYSGLLRRALKYRLRTLGIAGLAIAASLFLLPLIPISFLPSSGETTITAQMTVDGAPSREATLAELDAVESVLEERRKEGLISDYRSTYGSTGIFGAGSSRANTVNFVIRLTEDADGDAVVQALRRDLTSPGRTMTVATSEGGGPQNNNLELVLKGSDYTAIAGFADRLTRALNALEGLTDVTNDGFVSANPSGPSQAPITRIDGERAVTVRGVITARNTQRVRLDVQKATDELGLPAGVVVESGGTFADIDQTFRQMGIAMLAGIVLVYLVMVVTQRSLVTPFVIVLSLPLAVIGALTALAITQRALGLPSLIGLLMLVGLVVTNAIVLIAFVEQLRAGGASLMDALMDGGRTRLRPILMTAITTIFVLMPLAFGLGGANAGLIGKELATVVIGGLLTSTFLTLVVIPVVYSYLRRKGPRPGAAVPLG